MDIIEKRILFKGRAVVNCLDTTDLVNDAIKAHNLSDTAASVLADALTMAAYFSGNFKSNRYKLSIVVDGAGPIGRVAIAGNYGAKVVGFVENPSVKAMSKEEALGNKGSLVVTKDFGLKEPYVGYVGLKTANLAKEFERYYEISEQLPTFVHLDSEIINGKCIKAGGIVICKMPNATEEQMCMLEDTSYILSDIISLLKEKSPKQILDYYFENFEASEIEAAYPLFDCACSREYIMNSVIKSIGKKEAEKILKEDGEIVVKCHYCATKYKFTDSDIRDIF